MTSNGIQEQQSPLAGIFLDRAFAGMAWDKDRDAFTQGERVRAWDNLNAQHELNKAMVRPYDHKNVLISGDKGVGKSLGAAALAMINYSQGMEVFSTASFLFGRRIEAMDVFTMAESLPSNCVIFIDEAHSVADRYSENASRNRTLASSIALLRKNGIRLIWASVHEHAVAMSIKSEIDTLVYPATYRPADGKYAFPPWCYIYVNLIGPQPFRGRREADNWNIERFGGAVRKVRYPMPPAILYEAAKLMDSWAKPDIAAGLMISAADVKTRLEKNDVAVSAAQWFEKFQDLLKALVPVIRSGWAPTKRVHFRAIIGELSKLGEPINLTDEEIREICRMYLSADASGHVLPREIFKHFNVSRGLGEAPS